jgi:antitoxin component of RelBE/YafQ-DinJ toxin-antitoxin module
MTNSAGLMVKLPVSLRQRAHAVAKLRGETVSDVVRTALEDYVARNTIAAEVSRSAEEDQAWENDSIFDIIGIGAGGPPDLSC